MKLYSIERVVGDPSKLEVREWNVLHDLGEWLEIDRDGSDFIGKDSPWYAESPAAAITQRLDWLRRERDTMLSELTHNFSATAQVELLATIELMRVPSGYPDSDDIGTESGA